MQLALAISQIDPQHNDLLSSNDGRVTALIDASRVCEFDSAALDIALAEYEAGDFQFRRQFEDNSSQNLSFNVMPSRHVNESLTPNQYSVGRRIARVVFNRDYETEMEKSPSHMVFLSALVQWQKLIYLVMCEEHEIVYNPNGKEIFKIWPTDVRCCLPVLVTDEESLHQDTVIFKHESVAKNKWHIEAFSTVNSRLGFLARASVYKIASDSADQSRPRRPRQSEAARRWNDASG